MMTEQPVIGHRVIRLETTGSTMDDVAALAERGEPEGVVVVTAEQTAGRGRAGRSWVTPAGTCVLCSILLRPRVAPTRLGVLPLIAGVAVAAAIDDVIGGQPSPPNSLPPSQASLHRKEGSLPIQGEGDFILPSPSIGRGSPRSGGVRAARCRLKWPNDVWLDERKVAGLLMVAKTAGDRVESAVLGVGVNVDITAGELPPGATSLLTETGRRFPLDEVLNAVLARLDDAYQTYVASDGQPSLSAWRERAALLDERVSVRDGERVLTGWMRGVGDRGELLLELDSGEIQPVVAGDLTRGPSRA